MPIDGCRPLWRRLAILMLALIPMFPAWAGSVASPSRTRTTLDDLISEALQNNKELRAAHYAVDSARGRLLQAGLSPNPRLEISGRNDALFGDDGEYAVSIGVSQAFPIAGRIARQKDVARIDVALASAEVAEAQRKLAGDVAAAYFRLLVLSQQIQAREHLIAVDRQLVAMARNRLRAAEVAETDVVSAQLEEQRDTQQQSQLQNRYATQLSQLNLLLGRPGTQPLSLGEIPTVPPALPALDDLQHQALSRRPDLRTQQLKADRAVADQARARAERWEDWTVGLSAEQDRLVLDSGPPQHASRALGLSLSIPLPLKNGNQGQVAEAVAADAQARVRVEATVSGIVNEVARYYAEVGRLAGALQDYRRNLLPTGARGVALSRAAYRQGQTPVFTVVQAQRQQADVTQGYLDLLDQYLQSLAALKTAAASYGVDLAPTADVGADLSPEGH